MKILIVEDEPFIARDLEFTLSDAGYKVVGIAHTGSSALDMIENRKPELILLDISLKGHLTGIDVARILKGKKIPFIFVTSYSDKITLELAGKTLPYGYIVKPFKDRDILSNVEIAFHRFNGESKNDFPSHEKVNKKLHKKLSVREYEILILLWKGKTNIEISEEIFLSINTVKSHIRRVYNKLDVNSRSAAAAKVRELM